MQTLKTTFKFESTFTTKDKHAKIKFSICYVFFILSQLNCIIFEDDL